MRGGQISKPRGWNQTREGCYALEEEEWSRIKFSLSFTYLAAFSRVNLIETVSDTVQGIRAIEVMYDHDLLDGSALDMHVELANRKWVNISRLEITKTVIDETVRGFVGAHGVKDVLYRRVFGKTPVVFGDRRCCHLLPNLVQAGQVNYDRVITRDKDVRTIWGDGPVRAPQLRAYTSLRLPPRGNRRNDGKFSGRRYTTGLIGERVSA